MNTREYNATQEEQNKRDVLGYTCMDLMVILSDEGESSITIEASNLVTWYQVSE